MNYLKHISAVGIALMIVACSNKTDESAILEEARPKTIDSANFDFAVNPGDDFYQFVNGGWMAANPIPPEETRWGAFNILYNNNLDNIKNLFEDLSKAENQTGNAQKIGTFFKLAMDEQTIQTQSYEPVKPFLANIDAINTKEDVVKAIAAQHKSMNNVFFSVGASQDAKNSEQVIAHLNQSGLGLPDRDYYFAEDERSAIMRQKYQQLLAKLFEMIGESPENATKMANASMEIETKLAKEQMTRLEMRDPDKMYNKTDFAGLSKMAPNFDWKLYFTSIGAENVKELNINQANYFAKVGKIISSLDNNQLKAYLKAQMIVAACPYLSNDFVETHFDFYGRFMTGSKENQPRWKRMVNLTNAYLGEAVGEIYVAKFFPPEAKAKMDVLVDNIKAVLEDRIKELEWMSDVTKEKAQEKLGTMIVKIGYPDKWKSYENYEVKDDSFFANIVRGSEFMFNEDLKEWDKPVDRAKWYMTPQTVNAYYNPASNEIVFPAAILQPPFFDMYADDAVNYGGIGAVIGHEITHGFDDQGRKFDKMGNLNDWWQKEDAEQYLSRVGRIVDHYENFCPFEDKCVDGKLTLGENIADLGGVTIAYNALKRTEQGKGNDLIDGFTPAQRFFISYGQIWRQNIREEELRRRLKEDVHSPGEYRVNGVVANMPQFYEAFGISNQAALWIDEDKRSQVW